MNNKVKQFFLGLDIGTNSVGWAVTDQDYNVVRAKQFDVDVKGKVIEKRNVRLLGVRLFPEASTAAVRRNSRNNRRRLVRRRWRIMILRELFKKEMDKVDPTFFTRLDNSFYQEEDKPDSIRYMSQLFDGYNKNGKYKTIYHLRKEMLENPNKKFDIREIYLVFSHMIKYRGNFLEKAKFDFSNNKAIYNLLKEDFELINCSLDNLRASKNDYINVTFGSFNMDEFDNIYKIFIDYNSISKIKENMGIKSFVSDPKSLAYILFLAIIGSKVRLKKIYEIIYEEDELQQFDDEFLKNEIPYSSEDFEDDLDKLNLNDDIRDLIILGKQAYNHKKLTYLLKGSKSLSESMVKKYDEHKEQLKELKVAIKKYKPDRYKYFFNEFSSNDKSDSTYADYIGSYRKSNKFIRGSHCSTEKFYNSVKKLLGIEEDELPNADDIKKIKEYIDNRNFLLRQNSRDNNVIPYQLNEVEMLKIIGDQGKYYPFLCEKGKDYPNADKEEYKLISLLKFRIPYYVGPLSNTTLKNDEEIDKHNHWAKFNNNMEEKKIYPWNFLDIINLDESETKFIERLTNNCSYIHNEKCLPKFSLYFQAYKILNALNNVLFDNKPLTVDMKKDIIEKLYLTYKNVTMKNLKDYFKEKYNNDDAFSKLTTNNLKKFDKDNELIVHNLSTFVNFKEIFGDKFYQKKI